MADELKAIETTYKGYRFRSRLEARWAVFFDTLGIEWEYEPEGYELDGERYLPDFKLRASWRYMEMAGQFIYAEVKPVGTDQFEGRHVRLCRSLALATGDSVLLLVGPPAYRMYHQFMPHPDFGPRTLCNAFFRDYDNLVVTADDWWYGRALLDEKEGHLYFPHDDRAARNSFGRGLVEAVHAARSARFEHGEQPNKPGGPLDAAQRRAQLQRWLGGKVDLGYVLPEGSLEGEEVPPKETENA